MLINSADWVFWQMILSSPGSCGDRPIVPPELRPWKQKLRVKSSLFSPPLLSINCLWAPCPLMEASSHGKEGNQINCMSVNRITSSLTCRESELKLITHAWRNGRTGRSEEGEEQRRRTRQSQGFPSWQGLPPVCVCVCVCVCVFVCVCMLKLAYNLFLGG